MGIHSRARPTITSLLVSYGNGYDGIQIEINVFVKCERVFVHYTNCPIDVAQLVLI